ncbi:MAG: hypothetical protein FJ263_07805 [Planctomycetes bacterium]|nr:hypothetical protein [Planctomycetota bacterium]
METLTAKILDYLKGQSFQVAVVFIAVLILTWLLRNRSAHIRYLLWLVVAIKCLTPPLVIFSVPVLPAETIPVIVPHQNSTIEPQAAPIITEQPKSTETVTVLDNSQKTFSNSIENRTSKIENLSPRDRKPKIINIITSTGVLLSVWAAGAMCYLLWALGKAVRLAVRLRRIRKPLPAQLMIEQIEKLAKLWNYPGGFNVWLVDGITQPFVWGLWRGAIYLPTRFQSIEGDKQKAIVLHEMAHVVRFDAFVNLIQILIQGVFWFHPFVWLANRFIRQEREKCCDEIAVARLGTAPKEYGHAIVDTLLQEAKAGLAIPTLAVAGPVKNIEDRIKTIMQPGKRFFQRPSMIALLIIGLLALVTIPTTIALTQKITPPDYMLSGIVTDANDRPIAGAIVFDDGYGPQPYQKGITDETGKFEYKSWNEEHNVTAKADGYQQQTIVFKTAPFDNSKSLNFKLQAGEQQEKLTHSGQMTVKTESIGRINLPIGTKGKFINKYVDAIYGSKKEYSSLMYLGVVKNGQEVKLMDNAVYYNQFSTPIVKVEVLSNSYPAVQKGTIGWIQLKNTDFADAFEQKPDDQLPRQFKELQEERNKIVMEQYKKNRKEENVSLQPGQKTDVKIETTPFASISLQQDENVNKRQGSATYKFPGSDIIETETDGSKKTLLLGPNGTGYFDRNAEIQIDNIIIKLNPRIEVLNTGSDVIEIKTNTSEKKLLLGQNGTGYFDYNSEIQFGEVMVKAGQRIEVINRGSGVIKILHHNNRQRKGEELKAQVADSNRPFIAALPNGVTVELVGICEHPVKDKPWWRPDGRPLQDVPFDESGDRVHARNNDKVYDFAVMFRNIPNGLDAIIRAEPSSNFAGGSLYCSVSKNGKDVRKKDHGKTIETMSHLAAVFDKKQVTCTVKVGIAHGPWQADFEADKPKYNGTWGTSGHTEIQGGVVFGMPFEADSNTVMTVTDTVDRNQYDVRIVAVDSAGNEINAIRTEGGGVGKAIQTTVRFEQRLDSLATFRVQTRKYQWITFKNVSLKPGQKTDAKIEIPSGFAALAAARGQNIDSADAAQTKTLSGRVIDEDTEKPIPNALVRVAIPATDMRNLRKPSEHKILETRTDSDGSFHIALPYQKGQFVSVDVLAAGFSTAAGTYRSGGNPLLGRIVMDTDMKKWPMSVNEPLDIPLSKSLFVRGRVVDEQKNPIAGVTVNGQMRIDNGYSCIASTKTDANGRFEIFDFPLVKEANEKGELIFIHPQFEKVEFGDLYQLSTDKTSSLEIVLPKGLTAAGKVLDASGNPATGIKVEAGAVSRDCLTDMEGRFELAGLKKNDRLILTAYTEDFKYKAIQTLSPFDRNYNDTVLRLEPCDDKPTVSFDLLGMKVADVTPQLQKQFDLFGDKGVVILDPGKNFAILNIGELKPGYYFWMIGNKQVSNLKEMIAEILRIHTKPEPKSGGMIREGHHGNIRVVYGRRGSTNTQYLKLTDEQADQLRQLGKTLGLSAEQLNPPTPPQPDLKQVVYDCKSLLEAMPQPPANTRKQRMKAMEQFVQEIEKQIAPQSWDIVGGVGRLMFTETTLIIVQTPEIHEQIRVYLDNEKRKLSAQIAIEARFILADEAVLKQAGIDTNKTVGTVTTMPADSNDIVNLLKNNSLENMTLEPIEPNLLVEPQLKKLMESVRSDKNSKMLAAPKVLVRNMEDATIKVAAITEYADAGHQKKTFEKETQLTICPQADDAGKNIAVRLRVLISDLLKPDMKQTPASVPQAQVLDIPYQTTVPNETSFWLLAPQGFFDLSALPDENITANRRLLILIKPTIAGPEEQTPPQSFGGMGGGMSGGGFGGGTNQ